MISFISLTLIYLPLLYEKWYIKDTYKVIKHIKRNAKCSSGILLLWFHYINMLTYCVVINKAICSMLNKIHDIISYRKLDNTIILIKDKLSKIYHILFKPAINYNYYAYTIQE